MKCRWCGKRAHGLPDICPSCGAKIMALWNPWYQYPIYLGVFLILFGAAGVWHGVDGNDALRAVLGAIELSVGTCLVGIGMIMRGRFGDGKAAGPRETAVD